MRMYSGWLRIAEDGRLDCDRCGGHYAPDYGHYEPAIVMNSVDWFLAVHMQCVEGQSERDKDNLLAGVKTAMEVKVVDPACGTGMFLVEAFAMLVGLRVEEERIPQWVAAELVIRDNLFGLDVDPRALELCRFALWLEVSKRGGNGMAHKRRGEEAR